MKCKKTVQANVIPPEDASQDGPRHVDNQSRNASQESLLSVLSATSEIEHDKPQNSVEKRLDSLESLLYKLTENLWPQPDSAKTSTAHARSRSHSSAGSSIGTHAQRKRAQSPSRYSYAYDNLFEDEDININSFEHVMIATFRTMQELCEENANLSGIISHGLFMAEKAAAGVYIADSFTGYDRLVRKKANKKGLEAFGKVSELERNRFFNLENHREVRALKARNKSSGQSKKSATCRHYNGEQGCYARTCNYVHRCAICETPGHPSKECKSARKEKASK